MHHLQTGIPPLLTLLQELMQLAERVEADLGRLERRAAAARTSSPDSESQDNDHGGDRDRDGCHMPCQLRRARFIIPFLLETVFPRLAVLQRRAARGSYVAGEAERRTQAL